MAQHDIYWSCSKFADFIRGTTAPITETASGWRIWKKQARITRPFRFWLAETGLDSIQDFVTWPIRTVRDVKYHIRNRWIDKTNSLTAHPRDIKPGDWSDVGSRMLPCMFGEFQTFVEEELGRHHVGWMDETDPNYTKLKNDPIAAAMAYLDWASELRYTVDWLGEDHELLGQLTHQAIAAIEIRELYHWWTVTYRAREDAYEASGWSALCDSRRSDDPDEFLTMLEHDRTPEGEAETKRILALNTKIEKEYADEDEAMMIRLVKIRDGLWT